MSDDEPQAQGTRPRTGPPPLPLSQLPPTQNTPELVVDNVDRDRACGVRDRRHERRLVPWLFGTVASCFVLGLSYLLIAPPAWLASLVDPTPLKLEQRATARAKFADPVNAAIRKAQSQLSREPCDQTTARRLANLIHSNGRKRDAADLLVGQSTRCGGHPAGLRRAANIYLEIGDHEKMQATSTRLITLQPFHNNGYFLRGLARHQLKLHSLAANDFASAIELFPNKRVISSVAYERLALAYEKAERPCDAASAINQWVYLNPQRNDNSQTRRIIRQYRQSGSCSPGSEAQYKVGMRGSSATFEVKASINGTTGTFVLDTGASFVTIGGAFARKAGIEKSNQTVVLQTANGKTNANTGIADTVSVGDLTSSRVPLLVQWNTPEPYGSVDGLLGMSFLSRFDMTLSNGILTLRTPKL